MTDGKRRTSCGIFIRVRIGYGVQMAVAVRHRLGRVEDDFFLVFLTRLRVNIPLKYLKWGPPYASRIPWKQHGP